MWLRLPIPDEWDGNTYRIRIRGGEHGLFIPTHPDSVRVGFNIPKGGLKDLRAQGLGALHERLDRLAPELSTTVRKEVAVLVGHLDAGHLHHRGRPAGPSPV